MSLENSLHVCIDRFNILEAPTKSIDNFFNRHPDLHKIALIINHIFRAVAMTAFCIFLPYTASVNLAICFGASLFYRLTVETNCAYKFALPALAGSIALPMGRIALNDIVKGVAFETLKTLGHTLFTLAPAVAYLAYIILTVSYDVTEYHRL